MQLGESEASSKRLCAYFLAGAAILFGQYAYILGVQDFYPSISLPGGAAKVHDGATFDRSQWLVFALMADGSRRKIDEHELLSPLPGPYRTSVIGNGFGLKPGSRASDEEAVEARAWLRERLRAQLGSDDVRALEIVLARYTSRTEPPRSYLPTANWRIDL